MRRKELIDHFREMTPKELLENYFEAQLNTAKKHRSIEINEGIDICIRSLEISLIRVFEMNKNQRDLEMKGGFFI